MFDKAICAPTGSGKTVLLEMAIIHELIKCDKNSGSNQMNQFRNVHVLYLAPLKAIVEEKCGEWQTRFSRLGLTCFSLTGDTELDNYRSFRSKNYSEINLILATPEKFDQMIRNEPESRQLLQHISLILIDEIHMLADSNRG